MPQSEARSRNMSAIRNRDTGPEIYFRKLLFAEGYRYRVCQKNLPGRPDVFLRKFYTAIFVHGCFWHRHNDCKYAYTPKSRIEFWDRKFEENTARDARVISDLVNQHIKCLIVWECTIRKMKVDYSHRIQTISKVKEFFESEDLILEL